MTRQPDEHLRRILHSARSVLLDFDGPVCPIFAAGLNSKIAARLRSILAEAGHPVPADLEHNPDPLDVLRFAHQLGPTLTEQVDDALRAEEVHAARIADPTPGAHRAITACRASGRPIAIVSNNSAEAIRTYLDRHDLTSSITTVIGRPYARPDLMKPDPTILTEAITELDTTPQQCVLIGDSLTDIEAAHRVGTHSIGYAKTPSRRPSLETAGADVVIDSMETLATTLESRHRHDHRP